MNNKPGFLFLVGNESISQCLANRKAIPIKAIKQYICKLFKGYNLIWVDTVKRIPYMFIQKYLMNLFSNSQRSNMPAGIYQERIFYSSYCKRFEQINTKICIHKYLNCISNSKDKYLLINKNKQVPYMSNWNISRFTWNWTLTSRFFSEETKGFFIYFL